MNIRYFAGLPIYLFVPLILVTIYSAFWDVFRPLGVIPLAIVIVFFLLGILLSKRKYLLIHIVKPYVGFAFVVTLYISASYKQWLPYAYDIKIFYDSSFILQQAVGFLVLFITVLFFTLIFIYNPQLFARKHFASWLVIVCYFLFTIVGYFFASASSAITGAPIESLGQYFSIGTLINSELFITFFAVFLIFNHLRTRKSQFFWLLALLVISGSFQSTLAVLLAISLLVIPAQLVVIGFILGLVIVVPTSMAFPVELFEFDPNTGLRSMFWLTGLNDFIETNAIGIGFGTEALQPQYYAIYRELAILDVDSQFDRFMTTGMHNTFIDVMQRLGILGIGCFTWLVFSAGKGVFRSNMLPFDAWVFCTLLLSLSVNVALSINIIFGTSLMLGWLHARKLMLLDEMRDSGQ